MRCACPCACARPCCTDFPSGVGELLAAIADGMLDDRLEEILAAAHGRKRARRGVRRPYGLTLD